jgi:hypothetical protein
MTSGEVNGSAMAAFLGGGIGAFAMGAVVLLNEAGCVAAFRPSQLKRKTKKIKSIFRHSFI